MDFYQFSVPTRIVFGNGLARDFAAELDSIPAQKYFVITDKVILSLKLADPIIEGIKKSGREVTGIFADVPPDSGIKVIEAASLAAKLSGAEGIIAIGGGSVMDTAKGANILFSLGGNLVEDYSGAQTITEELCPLIAIPTTAGTGSEVTEAIVVLDDVTHTKLSFVDRHLLPTLAILDPELTTGLPPQITAATALDALTHAVEAVMSIQRGPVSDALAFQAVSLIFKNLETALAEPKNLEARGALLVASNLAGIAFNHSMVGVVHSVAHTVGALFRVHHGTANGIFLPYGMEYNCEVREKEVASLAPFVGVGAIHELPLPRAKQCIEAVTALRARIKKICGLPTSLREVGVKKEDLLQIAKKAPDDGSSFYNPRPVTEEDLLPYLEKAW
ncbi:MAG: iron-containing alcohol dehydrogenase [Deltaproteobacteria bacterium]|nr:iron-containing alcohol dehydrogenase [Deltaproteobacteria bacterium]